MFPYFLGGFHAPQSQPFYTSLPTLDVVSGQGDSGTVPPASYGFYTVEHEEGCSFGRNWPMCCHPDEKLRRHEESVKPTSRVDYTDASISTYTTATRPNNHIALTVCVCVFLLDVYSAEVTTLPKYSYTN